MNLRYLKKELEFSESVGIVYGMVGQYLVTFSLKRKSVELFIDAKIDPADTVAVDRLRAFIQNNAVGYHITASSLSNTGISMTLSGKDQEVMMELVNILINELRLLKISGATHCSNCGEPIEGKQQMVKIGSHAHVCDSPCAERIMGSDKAKAARVKIVKRGLPGFFGALIFSGLAAALYFFLGIKSLPCYYAAVLIPVAADLGFFLFGGKRGWAKMTACALLPLFFFALAVFGLLLYPAYAQWTADGYLFTFAEFINTTLNALKTSTVLAEGFNRQLLFGGICLTIGYVAALPSAYARPIPYFALLKPRGRGKS